MPLIFRPGQNTSGALLTAEIDSNQMKDFFRSAIIFAFIGAALAFTLRVFRHPMPPPAAVVATSSSVSGEPAVSSSSSTRIQAPAKRASKATDARALAGQEESVDSLLAQITTLKGLSDDASWNRLLNEIFPALLLRDRAAATRVVEGMPFGEKRELLLRRLARSWAATDFEGVVGWLGGLTRPEDQKPGFEEACFGAMETSPAEAVRVWEKCAFTADDHVLSNLVQNWAIKDLEAAKTWVATRPPSLQRDQAVARIAYVMAQSKPGDAAGFVAQEIPSGPMQTEAVISVLHRWAENDPAGATAWAANFSEPVLRDRAIGELAGITQKTH